MKLIKYLLICLFIIGLGISSWFYYPIYEMEQMKKHAAEVSHDTSHVSYLNYFRNTKKAAIYHLAIGDSVIRGVGAEQNQNFVSQFSNKLAEQIHKKIQFQNEGINGITSSELKTLVQSGRFDNEIKKADIVTINVGGNDILRMAKKQSFQNVFQAFHQLQSTFSDNLSDIAARIKKINPNATIVFLELYNPLSPKDQVYQLADQLLPKWNVKIYEVANQYPLSMVIETTKVINGEQRQNLAPDGVHPNSAGYTAISEQMMYQFKHQYRKQSV